MDVDQGTIRFIILRFFWLIFLYRNTGGPNQSYGMSAVYSGSQDGHYLTIVPQGAEHDREASQDDVLNIALGLDFRFL